MLLYFSSQYLHLGPSKFTEDFLKSFNDFFEKNLQNIPSRIKFYV